MDNLFRYTPAQLRAARAGMDHASYDTLPDAMRDFLRLTTTPVHSQSKAELEADTSLPMYTNFKEA